MRSRISSAISRTVRSGAAVTTDSVMTSRISTGASLQSRAVAHRTPRQLQLRRRVEAGIGLVAPLLDLVLYAGDSVARVAGRNQVDPEPPRACAPARAHPDRRPAERATRGSIGPDGRDREPRQQQLEWEARQRPRAAIAALLAAAATLGADLFSGGAFGDAPRAGFVRVAPAGARPGAMR